MGEPVFRSRRSFVAARGGMTASSQPLASRTGLRVLEDGGNAADAAVAMAAALNVTEPCSTGIGGDCFALYYEAASRRVTALNGSGRAPAALTIDLLRRQGIVREDAAGACLADPLHAHAVTVPGACAGWCDLLSRHGTIGIAAALAPAIRIAEEGFPVAPLTAYHWGRGAEGILSRASGGRALTIDGRGPRPAEVFRNPGLARTFREVAAGGADAFYRGAIARDLADAVQRSGGVMSIEDLAAHRSTWEEPISTTYRGMRVWECPPNGQGIVALIALGILDGLDLGALPAFAAERWHLVIEAIRLAFADALAYVADPAAAAVPVAGLLDPAYLASRRALIEPGRALPRVEPGTPARTRAAPWAGDTVYFCAVDGKGDACSFINSNYMGFGTGIVPAGAGGSWGFSLQNRGANFSLEPSHPNALAPGKRPYHTIIPSLITRSDGSLFGPFGVMGAFMQPQGHVQVAIGLLDDALDPQSALDRPRFCVEPGSGMTGTVRLEDGVPEALAAALTQRGHRVETVSGYARALFGRGQVIERRSDGVLVAGSDPRADGCAMGYEPPRGFCGGPPRQYLVRMTGSVLAGITAIATFGGGCFWCLEAVFERVDGVTEVVSGYAGGAKANPTYEEVCTGTTGHAEVVQVHYDPKKASYAGLLEMFFKAHDPTTLNRQGADVGTQYRSIILYENEEQRKAAEAARKKAQKEWKDPIVTEIVPLKAFYRAEDYHQDYFDKNRTAGYCRVVIAPKLEKLKLAF